METVSKNMQTKKEIILKIEKEARNILKKQPVVMIGRMLNALKI